MCEQSDTSTDWPVSSECSKRIVSGSLTCIYTVASSVTTKILQTTAGKNWCQAVPTVSVQLQAVLLAEFHRQLQEKDGARQSHLYLCS